MGKLLQFGFSKYSDMSLYRTGSIDKIHIDLYSNNTYNLYARITESNVTFLRDDGRFILFNDDDEVLIDIVIDKIEDSMCKIYGDSCREITFSINGVKYRLLIYGSKTSKMICA